MKLSKKLMFLCLLLSTLFLAGCGIEVKTNMTINNQFEGSKVISCFVSKQDMNLHFKGDSSKIDAMLDNHCPGCFEHTKNETKAGTEYIFTLNFTSLDNYKAALRSVLNFSPEVNYKGVNSIFSKSIDFTENFTSIDLLRWFEILLTEEYEITDAQLEKLWDIKDTTVVWMDQSYTSESDSIQIADHHYSAFDGISIYTEEHDDRTFTRRIQFAVPKSTLDTRVLELENLFKEMKPEGTTGIWTTTDTGKIYEMTFQADTFESLSEKTGLALHSKSQNISADPSFADHQYLKMHLSYSETLDFSKFLSTEKGEVPVTYYFKPNSFTEINSERLQKEINNAFIPKEYEDGYFRIFSGTCSTLKITTLGTMALPVEECNIVTTLEKDNYLKRETVFNFKDILHQKEEELLSSLLKSNSSDSLKMELLKDKKNFQLSITQSGAMDEINQSSDLLFGTEGNLITQREPGFLDLVSNKKMTEIHENINLSRFLGTNADSVTVKYTFKDNSPNTLEECYIMSISGEKTEPISKDDKTCFFEIAGTEFSSHYTGSTPSITGISIFIVLVLIIIVGIILFIKKDPMKRYLSTDVDIED